jgi:hypothetical protein
MSFSWCIGRALFHTLIGRLQYFDVLFAERIFGRPNPTFDFGDSIKKLDHGFLVATRGFAGELGYRRLQSRNPSRLPIDLDSDLIASRFHDQSRQVFRSLGPTLWITGSTFAKLRHASSPLLFNFFQRPVGSIGWLTGKCEITGAVPVIRTCFPVLLKFFPC